MSTAPAPLELPERDAKLDAHGVQKLLWNRYTDKGEYILLFNVPDAVGTNSKRFCDAVAIGMWSSSGRLIQGFEIKVSRSDWLRELKDVTKADPFIEQCDRWWLVTADASIAQPAEIPMSWGWMVATKNGLRIQKPAPALPQHETQMKRLWAYSLIRRAFERGAPDSPEFRAQLQHLEDDKRRQLKDEIDRERARIAPEFQRLKERVEKFEADSGMKLEDWRLGNVGKLARAIHAASEDGYRGYRKTLESQVRELRQLTENLQAVLTAMDSPALENSDDHEV